MQQRLRGTLRGPQKVRLKLAGERKPKHSQVTEESPNGLSGKGAVALDQGMTCEGDGVPDRADDEKCPPRKNDGRGKTHEKTKNSPDVVAGARARA